MITKDIADAVRERRKQLGKTQAEMAAKLGKSGGWWGLMETASGQVNPDLEEVARVLECDVMDLMSGAITPVAASTALVSHNGNGARRAKVARRKEAPAPAENSGGGGADSSGSRTSVLNSNLGHRQREERGARVLGDPDAVRREPPAARTPGGARGLGQLMGGVQ